jgi:hypothetical protein
MARTLSIGFQPDLLGIMSQFSQFEATLKKYMAIATEKSAGLVATGIQGYMDFMNPSGVLEESVEVRLQSEYRAWIGSALPYAHRREWSFKGPDSLGRMFWHDPATHMARKALKDSSVLMGVIENYIEAVYAAWQDCVGALPPGTATFLG